jgi:carotenoid isomerooxygenase
LKGKEDEGVLIMSLLRSNHENEVSLLVLNAQDMTEIGRVQFDTNGPVPKCLHCLWIDSTLE